MNELNDKELEQAAGGGATRTDRDPVDLLLEGYTRHSPSDGENCPGFEGEGIVFSDGTVLSHQCLFCKNALATRGSYMNYFCTKKL